MSAVPAWSQAIDEGRWIVPLLAAFGTTVTSVVPAGFEAYGRILHPGEVPAGGDGTVVRWREVAAWSGMPLGPNSEFHSVALPPQRPDLPAPWRGQGPGQGSLYPPDAAVLARHLRDWTATPQDCWFGLWEGFCGEKVRLSSTPIDQRTAEDTAALRVPSPLPAAVREGPHLDLPNRSYLLYRGAVEAGLATTSLDDDQVATLWWPQDRSWFVASEVDLDWTYVAGPAGLITDLVSDSDVEVLPVSPDDPLSRIEEWVDRWVQDAIDQLLNLGDATIVTSRGTLRARLEQTSRRRQGLTISSVGDNGVTSGIEGDEVHGSNDAERRRYMSWRLTAWILDLVG